MYLFHFHKHFSFQLYVVFSKSLQCHQFSLKDIITNTWRARSYSFSIIRRRYQTAICFWYFLTEISLARLLESFSVGNHYIALFYFHVVSSVFFLCGINWHLMMIRFPKVLSIDLNVSFLDKLQDN